MADGKKTPASASDGAPDVKQPPLRDDGGAATVEVTDLSGEKRGERRRRRRKGKSHAHRDEVCRRSHGDLCGVQNVTPPPSPRPQSTNTSRRWLRPKMLTWCLMSFRMRWPVMALQSRLDRPTVVRVSLFLLG